VARQLEPPECEEGFDEVCDVFPGTGGAFAVGDPATPCSGTDAPRGDAARRPRGPRALPLTGHRE
jgi:hypothetical protein